MTQYQLETILAHAGINSDEATGALASPIHFNNLPTSRIWPFYWFDYTRTKNPTRATVEKHLQLLKSRLCYCDKFRDERHCFGL